MASAAPGLPRTRLPRTRVPRTRRSRFRRFAGACAAACAAVLAAGCATVPTVGVPEPVTGATVQNQPYVQPIPPQPDPGWLPKDIVRGFLAASASFTDDHAAARRFLVPALRRSWRPSWAVTVVDSNLHLSASRIGPDKLKGPSPEIDSVSLAGQQLATISNVGQYLASTGSRKYVFRLAEVGNQWLITGLPRKSTLVLTQADFEEVYQPRNLYFWSRTDQSGTLVPEPVFAPEQDTDNLVATNLVDALLSDQGSWLTAATTTAFPRGTTLDGPVTISGSSAVVNLGGAAASADAAQLQRMAAQLVLTLTGTSYSQAPISRSVMLEVNGRPRDIDGQRAQVPASYQDLLPGPSRGVPLYFINPAGGVNELSGGQAAHVVQGPAGREHPAFGVIAVSPGPRPQVAAAVAAGHDCVIYYGPLAGSSPLARRTLNGSAGPCTSLSWDRRGDIWAVSGQNYWVLPPSGQQTTFRMPVLPGLHPTPYRVLSLRVAPDGVRIAMLIQTRGGSRQLLLTAISGTQLPLGQTTVVGTSLANPVSASWYDTDHLIVLAGSELYEVPANGGPAVPAGLVPPGTTAISAAGPGQIAATGHGLIMTYSGPDHPQQHAIKGTAPAYPG